MSLTTIPPLVERFAQDAPSPEETEGLPLAGIDQSNSEMCVNQMSSVVAQMNDNANTCNVLDDSQQFQVNRQMLRQQQQEFVSRFNAFKKRYDMSSAFVDASNKAATLADNANSSNMQANHHQQLLLSKFNSDAMTAKRVATLSQQNLINTNVVIGYMQTCCIFFSVAILVMFPFAFSVVRNFFRHPMVVMQILLIVVAVIGIVVVLLHLWANRNHYWMLYQERVFGSPKKYVKKKGACECGPASSDDPPPVEVAVADDTCS